jgi:hypothetical protein
MDLRWQILGHHPTRSEGELREVYVDGRRIVERKMRRHGEDGAAAALPATCPYTVEQVLGDWLPDTGPA